MSLSDAPLPLPSKRTIPERKSTISLHLAFAIGLSLAATSGFSQSRKSAADGTAGPADKAPPAEKGAPDSTPGLKPVDGGGGAGAGGGRRRPGGRDAGGGSDAKVETAYDFHLIGPDGKDVPLSDYKDKYLLIVNLGRKSSYNDQLAGLIKLNDTYKSKGLVVIGIPSNEFGDAEPGTPAEILKAYADAKVDFPVMGLSKLIGDDALPFYTFLTKDPAAGPVAWNYTKFIIDKKGALVARLDPDVKPDSPEMLSTIDEVLDGTYKPQKAPGAGGRAGGKGPAAAE
jgi:glutathione peroxidase